MKITQVQLKRIIKEEITLKQNVQFDNFTRSAINEAQLKQVVTEELQLMILEDLRDDGVISEEQLDEIFRALKSMATKTADRARGAMAGAKEYAKGVGAAGVGKAATAMGLKGTAAGAASDVAGFKAGASSAYKQGKIKSRLTRFAKNLQAQEEDMTKDLAAMGIEDNVELKAAMKFLRSARTRAVKMLKQLETGQLAAGGEKAKELPAASPAAAPA